MIDDFLEEQEIMIKVLKNSVKKNRVNHAYLFETNGYLKKESFALAFAKYLLCPKNYSNDHKCENCQQCRNIENGSFSELKHIYPDGLWIKKEQLSELQEQFSETSIQSNKRVYIIHAAERLNESAANSILKFLEEPEDNIIAILLTDNIHQLLDTIVSRCQIISFARNNDLKNKTFLQKIKLNIDVNSDIEIIDDNLLQAKIEKLIKFVLYYEKNKLDTVLHTQKLFHNNFKTKNEIIMALEIMNLFYLDVIKYKVNITINIFNENNEEIKKIAGMNTLYDLYNKIEIILKAKENIKYNINNNLLIDKLLMDMEEGQVNG